MTSLTIASPRSILINGETLDFVAALQQYRQSADPAFHAEFESVIGSWAENTSMDLQVDSVEVNPEDDVILQTPIGAVNAGRVDLALANYARLESSEYAKLAAAVYQWRENKQQALAEAQSAAANEAARADEAAATASTLQSAKDSLSADHEALQGKMAVATTRALQAESQLAEAQARVGDAEARVAALEAEIAQLIAPPVEKWGSFRVWAIAQPGYLNYAARCREASGATGDLWSTVKLVILSDPVQVGVLTAVWNQLIQLISPVGVLDLVAWNDHAATENLPIRWNLDTGAIEPAQ